MVGHVEDSTSNNITTGSGHISLTQLIDTSINDVQHNKNTLVLKMESVISLMRQVECEEKAAEQAKEDAAQSSLDILVKLDQCKRARRHAEETNDMVVRKLYVHKAVLPTKMEVFQLRTSHLLDEGDRFFKVLDELSRSFEMRLTSTLMKKEMAFRKKQENESFARTALACEEIQMNKVEQESKILKKEAMEITKLLDFLIDHDHVLAELHGEISDNCRNVNQLKEELDHGIPLSGMMSILAASTSSLTSFESDENKNIVFSRHIKSSDLTENFTERGQTMSSDGFVCLQPSIECKDFVENFRDVAAREVNKPYGNKLCAKGIKKVKTQKSLHGNQKFAIHIKKLKIKGLQVVSKRMAVADYREDSSDFIYMVTLRIFLIMVIVIYVSEIFMCLIV